MYIIAWDIEVVVCDEAVRTLVHLYYYNNIKSIIINKLNLYNIFYHMKFYNIISLCMKQIIS